MENYSTEFNQDNSIIEIKELKKKSNLVGLMSLTATTVFFCTSFVLALLFRILTENYTIPEGYDNIINYLYGGLINLIGIGVVGMIFILLKKDSTSSQLPFKKVEKGTLFPLITIGFSVCMVANLMTNLYLGSTKSLGFDLSFSGSESSLNTTAEIIIYLLSVAVVPAVSEEILFRGAILSTLRKYGDGTAVFVSALIFGLFHGNMVQIPFAFIVGLVFGWTVVYTNSMLPAILIHFINNSFSVILAILEANMDVLGLSTEISNFGTTAVVAIMAVLSIFFAMKLSRKDRTFLSLNKYNGNLSQKDVTGTIYKNPLIIVSIILLCIETIINHIS